MCAKQCVESEILSCLQPNKLICYYFLHVGRRQEIPGSKTKGVITHDNSIRQFYISFHLITSSLTGMIPRAHCGCLYTQWVVLWGNSVFGGFATFIGS